MVSGGVQNGRLAFWAPRLRCAGWSTWMPTTLATDSLRDLYATIPWAMTCSGVESVK